MTWTAKDMWHRRVGAQAALINVARLTPHKACEHAETMFPGADVAVDIAAVVSTSPEFSAVESPLVLAIVRATLEQLRTGAR